MPTKEAPKSVGLNVADDQLHLASLVAAMNRVQALIEFDLTGRVLAANENFLALMGYELSEIQGQHHRMFCASDYTKTEAYAEFWRFLQSGQFRTGEFKRVTKAGREIWIQASYNPIFNAAGDIVKIVKFATDITET
ncbi:MAG: chemotaxis protein, partial [Burkholderiales bacterium PBB4]